MLPDGRFPGERIVVTAFVVEHPHGVFLFDTGFSPEPKKLVDQFAPVEMRPIAAALRAAGYATGDVKLIANCHFHPDHAGGNRHFPKTPILVQRRELAHARAPHGPYPEWIPRVSELDPWRVLFAHDRAVWQRDAAASIV